MKIAIVTREDDRSPKVLAKSLQYMFQQIGHECDVLFVLGTLVRLWPWFKKPRFASPVIKRLYAKLKFYKQDTSVLQKLSTYDVIIISDCTPNAFWRNLYQVESLRKKTAKPVCIHEVYYLGNAPTQIKKLKEDNDAGIDRYDWHLAVADVTEIKTKTTIGWSRVGLSLQPTGLAPVTKKEFLVIVDFEQPGYEQYRKDQIEVLEEADIKYIALEGVYKMQELREIYKMACVLLLQFPEAFGVPIAECLATGAIIGTASSAWPMSWRLNDNPEVHSEGILPDCFFVYSSKISLKEQLQNLKLTYDLQKTPVSVFNSFIFHYPHFYFGDTEALKLFTAKFEKSKIS